VLGRLVLSEMIQGKVGATELNLQAQSNGMYFITITGIRSETLFFKGKFIKEQ
jgi:hypothetical protein